MTPTGNKVTAINTTSVENDRFRFSSEAAYQTISDYTESLLPDLDKDFEGSLIKDFASDSDLWDLPNLQNSRREIESDLAITSGDFKYSEKLAKHQEWWKRYVSALNATMQANANNQCAALAEFWASEEGQDWQAVIERKVREEINTPELQAWWEDFNRRFPLCQSPR